MVIVPIQPMKMMEFSSEEPVKQSGGLPFSDILKDAVNNLEQTQETANNDGYQLAIGDVDDLAQIQINSMKAEAMLQTTVQLSTRLVNAYKEIMQMQV